MLILFLVNVVYIVRCAATGERGGEARETGASSVWVSANEKEAVRRRVELSKNTELFQRRLNLRGERVSKNRIWRKFNEQLRG